MHHRNCQILSSLDIQDRAQSKIHKRSLLIASIKCNQTRKNPPFPSSETLLWFPIDVIRPQVKIYKIRHHPTAVTYVCAKPRNESSINPSGIDQVQWDAVMQILTGNQLSSSPFAHFCGELTREKRNPALPVPGCDSPPKRKRGQDSQGQSSIMTRVTVFRAKGRLGGLLFQKVSLPMTWRALRLRGFPFLLCGGWWKGGGKAWVGDDGSGGGGKGAR